jgi:hypothetical protein
MVIEYFSLFYLLFLKSSSFILFVKHIILFNYMNKYNILSQNFSFLFFGKSAHLYPAHMKEKSFSLYFKE